FERTLSVTLPEARTQALVTHAAQAYRARVEDVLLTALALVVCRLGARDSALIEIESHGRGGDGEDALSRPLDLSRTVGWFTALYPVRLAPDASDLGRSLITVKEQLRAVPRRGLGYG